MAASFVEDLTLSGKRVLVRVDFNVPLEESDSGTRVVSEDTRIRASLPTIKHIIASGGKAILMSHLGRPKGAADEKYSLEPVARHLGTLLDIDVRFCNATTGRDAEAAVADLQAGSVLVLENTRFDPRETANDDSMGRELAHLADVYVNDAFGSAHRAHASTEAVTHFVNEKAMGYLLKRETDYLSRLLDDPDKPFTAILGGAKVSDKIGVIRNLLELSDTILIGGAMSYTLLLAQGKSVGTSLVEADKIDEAKALLSAAGEKIKLPIDHVVAAAFDNDAETATVKEIPEGMMGVDIGPETIDNYGAVIESSRTVVWNGPMGVFEMSNFAQGTIGVAKALARATRRGALTVVGGGDSVAAISKAGFDDDVSHVSTGGGAMLEFLEGKQLPGLSCLEN